MSSSGAEQELQEHFEISMRFRHMIEQRITRLESDAAFDELVVTRLDDDDHIRRHLRLIEAQRAEANRMKRFLTNSSTRVASR